MAPTCGPTVTYTDPEGEGKTAKMESDFKVQRVPRGNNMAPEFADDQDPNMPGCPSLQPVAKRSVAENTGPAQTVGDPVWRTDKDGDVLTYTLTDAGGNTHADSAYF